MSASRFIALVCACVAINGAQAERMTREYKIDLDPTQFSSVAPGNDIRRIAAIVAGAARDSGATLGDTYEAAERQTVRYYDVPDQCSLRNAGWVLRERVDGAKRELTLKLRQADRAAVIAAKVDARGKKSKTKLEEDVTPPDRVWLSRSATVEIDKTVTLDRMRDATKVFPALSSLPASTRLAVVNDQSIEQTDVDLPRWRWATLKASPGITLWATAPGRAFAAAEFSFRIMVPEGDKAGALDAVERLYATLQAVLPRGADDGTKTAFIYRAGGRDFCR
ncbi:MAG: hypothetical protein QM803_04340 [Rhodocyclaceae bacterium]